MKKAKFTLSTMAIITIMSASLAQQKYAVLITGDNNAVNIPSADQWNNGFGMGDHGYDEFWNDTYLFWELLYKEKEYSNENINVLYGGGFDLTFPEQDDRYNAFVTYGFNITDQAATQSNVQSIFNILAGTITENDFLFVWVMSHGGTDATGSYFYSYDAQKIYDTQLAAWLGGIDAYKKTVFISVPSSGGFAEELEGERTVIITSSGVGEDASRADDQSPSGTFIENEIIDGNPYNHGEANYHLYSSLTGETPDFQTSYAGIELHKSSNNYKNLLINPSGVKLMNRLESLANGELFQNVPNPFSGNCKIYYKLSSSDNLVVLNIYNNIGQLIEKKNLGHKDGGVYGYVFQNNSLQNGLYFYSLVVNGVITDTKKMIVQN